MIIIKADLSVYLQLELSLALRESIVGYQGMAGKGTFRRAQQHDQHNY
jgi:hypothetical protein